jgi:hypothetical protein
MDDRSNSRTDRVDYALSVSGFEDLDIEFGASLYVGISAIVVYAGNLIEVANINVCSSTYDFSLNDSPVVMHVFRDQADGLIPVCTHRNESNPSACLRAELYYPISVISHSLSLRDVYPALLNLGKTKLVTTKPIYLLLRRLAFTAVAV